MMPERKRIVALVALALIVLGAWRIVAVVSATPMLGYANVTPTDGLGDPLVPSDPFMDGITPGSAGGDAFNLSWAVDAQGQPVKLDHADFVRITHALNVKDPKFGQSTTQVDAASLVRPLPR